MSRRRATAAVAAATVLLVSAPALARGGGGARTTSESYGPWLETSTGVGTGWPVFDVLTDVSDRYVSVTIADRSGLPLGAWIGQDVDRDGWPEHAVPFCGSIARYRLRAAAGTAVRVVLAEDGMAPGARGWGAARPACPVWLSVGGVVTYRFSGT